MVVYRLMSLFLFLGFINSLTAQNTTLNSQVTAPSTWLVDGVQDGSKAIITWSLSEAKNVDYFVVEKFETTKQVYETVGVVKIQGETQDKVFQRFSVTDNAPKKGVITYRVSMILNNHTPPQYATPIKMDFSPVKTYTISTNEYVAKTFRPE